MTDANGQRRPHMPDTFVEQCRNDMLDNSYLIALDWPIRPAQLHGLSSLFRGKGAPTLEGLANRPWIAVYGAVNRSRS
jgi:hypothetical protein